MNGIYIDKKIVGKGNSAFIIAEIGINHNGDVKLACEIIDAAMECGADAVKLQTYKTESFIHKDNPCTQVAKSCELSYDDHAYLFEYTRQKGGIIFSTPESIEDISFLKSLDAPAIKIASMDLNYKEFIKAAARTGKPLLVSTGMSYLHEVAQSIRWIVEEGNNEVVLFHCVSCYPTPAEECNVSVIPFLTSTFGCPVGYSDHTIGIVIPFAAVCMGANLIEKHFTLNKKMAGPDHAGSADPADLKELVSWVREYEKALGNGIKTPSKSEATPRLQKRRGIYAKRNLSKGEIIKIDDVQFLTPSSPESQLEYLNDFLGRQLNKDIPKSGMITHSVLK